MSYNLKNGFYDKDEDGKFKFNSARRNSMVKIVKNENPDILILQETNFFTGKKKPDYKKEFGYKYGIWGGEIWEGEFWGISLLSKYPLTFKEDYTTKHSKWVRAIIKIKGKKIMIDGVHPDPYHSEDQRKQWFKTVIRDRKNPYILAGDFNAFSPQDKYDKNKLINIFEGGFKSEEKHKSRSLVENILRGKAIRLLLKNNLTDTIKSKNKGLVCTHPTKIFSDKNEASMRIDYIFCSSDFKVIESKVIKNKLTDKSSDHYPIYSILEI